MGWQPVDGGNGLGLPVLTGQDLPDHPLSSCMSVEHVSSVGEFHTRNGDLAHTDVNDYTGDVK
ncbi:hypothetical protein D3C77_629440 [compost metagenome]